jgi:hypothetical protein
VTTNLPKPRLPLWSPAARAERVERRRLADELALYTTQADRDDLNALLDTYPDSQVAEIRDLLNAR